jgi:tetratricopeptide (TPR) repeat protein
MPCSHERPAEYDRLVALARDRRAAGDVRAAVEALGRAIDMEPGLADAHYQRGLLEADRDDLFSAESFIKQALQCDPENPVYLAAAAAVLDEAGRSQEAERFARKAASAAPGTCVPRMNLGLALRSQGRHDEAIVELTAAAGFADAVPEAALAAAELLAHRNRFDEAIETLIAARKRFGPHPQIDEGLAALTGTGEAAGNTE